MTEQGSDPTRPIPAHEEPTRVDLPAVDPDAPTQVGVPPVPPEPPAGGYGEGGDGDRPDRRPWILAAILGLIALIAIVLLLMDDDGDDEPEATTTTSQVETTTTESTTTTEATTTTESTTTTAPTTTTSESPPVTADPAQCRDLALRSDGPDDQANAVFIAWTRGDTGCASELMTPEALDELFSRDGSEAQDQFQGCGEMDEPDPHWDCAFTYEGGAAHYLMSFSPTVGWQVFDIRYFAD